jgi:aminoglycoside phosphotransferase (APT) family kinase protein
VSDLALMQSAVAHAGIKGDLLGAEPLSGGAIQENWLLTFADGRRMVLRCDAAAQIATSHSRATEFRVLQAAHAKGVTVPEPLALVEYGGPFGRPFFLMEAVHGIALGQKIVRDPAFDTVRPTLALRVARELALIHAIDVPTPLAIVLGPRPEDPATERLATYARHLAALDRPSPVIELGLRWLGERKPPPDRVGLVHRDLRTGNYLVDRTGLTAILDWEFAGWGDPVEDVAWFLSGDWRFGRDDLEAGGVGTRADFLAAYAEAAGWSPDPARLRFWEVIAAVRWAIIALQQGERFTKGGERRLELALVGRRVHATERRLLTQIEGDL